MYLTFLSPLSRFLLFAYVTFVCLRLVRIAVRYFAAAYFSLISFKKKKKDLDGILLVK